MSSASGSPQTPTISRKPAPPTTQRKASQEPPTTFDASQANQGQLGSQSPTQHQSYSPSPNPEIGRQFSSEMNVQHDDEPAPKQDDPEYDLSQEAVNEVQVPCTNPINEASKTPASFGGTESQSSRTFQSEQGTSPAETPETGVDHDLEDFEWKDFQTRYYDELSAIVKDEADLIAGFDRFSETFAMWAHSASQRDTDRASKRLKTRETFLVIAEESLQAKKAHYEQVVQAFQTAMALLRF